MNYEGIFSKLGFDFKVDLKPVSFNFDKNSPLTLTLNNSVFYYHSPNNTNTSFYLITIPLNTNEIEEIRRYIWNKNDADLIFYYPTEGAKLVIFYAKYSPKTTYKESVLDEFNTTQNDLDKIDKIRHWQFDSGAFWLNYLDFFKKAKNLKGIDKELVSTLEVLKKQLDKALFQLIENETERSKIVQALIDRTLYIKYLEDNHIINSHFYKHYFRDSKLSYEKLLLNNSDADLNKLFKKIHEIFNNALFDDPTIENKYLTNELKGLIASSFNTDLNTGQLKLFHFQFDVLPVEFISYIYEVFLSDKQKDNGIFYTPKKLAQLIVDDVIIEDKIGSILDPSSGSGMFLIVGYQKLLEIARKKGLEPKDSLDKIRFRTKLLSENIFGIEKEQVAQRFTLFSLSLQIFKGIDPEDIRKFIAKELEQNRKINLFSEFSFFENIKQANTLNISDKPFEDKAFSYIVGNPPFFEIPDTNEYKSEISFLKTFKIPLNDGIEKTAKDIIGKSQQISQCFFLKIKDWANDKTRFGFISNSSNFYNDKSENFQNYFYSKYGIEKIYELSRVKKILFENADESVIAIIFTNKCKNNEIDYYPVELGLFSEKPFELLIIQEDKVIRILQNKLINKELQLRDFLVGNWYDRELIKLIGLHQPVNKWVSSIDRGFEIWGEDARKKEFDLAKDEWSRLELNEKNEYLNTFINKYFSPNYSKEFNKPYIKPSNLLPFVKLRSIQYISSIENFHRPRNNREIYEGEKLIFTRIGSKLNCVFSRDTDYFDFSIYTIKLNEDLYYLMQAIFNSHIVQYYLDFYLRKRVFDSFSRIGNDDILKIPIPKELDNDLVKQISDLSQKLTEGKYDYSEKEDELNNLIYELYELSHWEKQRIEDYFLPDKEKRFGVRRTALNRYKLVLNEALAFYFKNPITIEEAQTEFGLKVLKLSLNNKSDTSTPQKTVKFLLNEIFEQKLNENFLASQEKIFGKDCVYIIKEDKYKNWTETKAFEDGQDLLKHLIPNKNGKRVH